MNELENLKLYLQQAEPEVNKALRNGDESDLTFDSLFQRGNVPPFLYRMLSIEHVAIKDDVVQDPAYLSCTTSIDNFIEHVTGSHIVCFKIQMNPPANRICVQEIEPNMNDEGEYILPRNSRIQVISSTTYSTNIEFEELCEQEELELSGKMLMDLYHIESITLYEMELL